MSEATAGEENNVQENQIRAFEPTNWAEYVKNRFEKMEVYKRDINTKIPVIDKRLARGKKTWSRNMDKALKNRYVNPKQYIMSEIAKDELAGALPNMSIVSFDAEDDMGGEKAVAVEGAIRRFENLASSEYEKLKAQGDAVDYGTGIVLDGVDYERGGIFTRYIDLRGFFVDENATDVNNAKDCILRDEISWADFRSRCGMIKGLKKTEQVEPHTKSTDEWKPLTEQELAEGKAETEGMVRIHEYFSIEFWKRIITANGIVILEKDYKKNSYRNVLRAKARLPITAYYYNKSNKSFWGTGLPELTSGDVDFQNAFLNLAIDRAKMSLLPMLIADSRTGIKKGAKMGSGRVIIADNKQGEINIKDGVQVVNMGGVPADFHVINSALRDNLAYTSRMPEQEMAVNTGETATRSKLKQEAKAKKIRGMVLRSLYSSEKWRYEHLIDCVQELTEYWKLESNTEKESRKIFIDDYWVSGEGKNQKFLKEAGAKGKMNLSAESVKGAFSVNVVAPEDKDQMKSEKQESFARILEHISPLLQMDQNLRAEIDVKELLVFGLETIGTDAKRILQNKNTSSADVDSVEAEHQKIMKGEPIEFPEDETPEISAEHLERHQKFMIENKEKIPASGLNYLINHIQETAKRIG